MLEPWKIAALVVLIGVHLGGIVAAVAFGLKRRPRFIVWQDVAVLATPTLLVRALIHAIGFVEYRSQVAQAVKYGETFVELRPSGEELWVGPAGSSLIERWSITNVPALGPIDAIVISISIASWAVARIRARSATSSSAA